jgi:putative ABC transport system permease protein
MQMLHQELRYGARMLLKNPGFTFIAVVTLALGIGANTAIFSVVNAVLLRPLPYEEPDRLVYLSERHPNYESMSISYPDFVDWRSQNHVFENIGVVNFRDYNLTGSGEPERLRTGQASADFFEALSVKAAVGRLYTNDEDKPGAQPVVLLSHELWMRRFGGDPQILNQSLSLNDRAYTVIGVMPADFNYSRHTDLWVPVGQLADDPVVKSRDNHPGLRAVARLKAGVTIEEARTELDAIAARLEQQYPDSNKNIGARMIPLLENYVRNVRLALWILLGSVGLVLLIACANVANLMLARAATRQREMAVRVALGASRWRIIRQLLIESLILAIVGGALGLLIAQWGVDLILAFSADAIPRASEIGLDVRVLAFTGLVSVMTGIIFGLAPALQSSRTDVQEALKETSRSVSGGRHRLRQMLVGSEVALTMVLLIGASLLMRSFYRLQEVNTGYVEQNVLSFRTQLSVRRYPKEQQWLSFYQQAVEKLHALPGVSEVSLASRVPMGENDWQSGFRVVGEPEPPPGQGPSMEISLVSPGYFHAMGIPLLRGRDFNEQDSRSGVDDEKIRNLELHERLRAGLRSVIVDEEFARRHWPDQDPVGKQILWGGSKTPPINVIGVVGRVKLYSPDETGGFVQAYFPFLEMPENGMAFVIKTKLEPDTIIAAARQQIHTIDPDQPVYDIKMLSQLRSESVAPQRFNLLLLGLFAALAFILALVGIYGVMSYTVTQRTHEIGLRIALGAQTPDVLKLIVRQAMTIASIGVCAGLTGAFALTRLMSSLLFGVSPTDPITFLAVPLVVVAVALLACTTPAVRASRVDPMIALRYE